MQIGVSIKEENILKLKKLSALLIALTLIVSLLAGCGSTSSPSTTSSDSAAPKEQAAEPAAAETKTEAKEEVKEETKEAAVPKENVVIRVWGGVPEEAGPNAAVEAFTEEFKDKGYSAEYIRFVNDDTGNLKLETTLLSGEGVDVFISYGLATLKKRVDGNMVLDLTELCSRDGFDLEKNFGSLTNSFLIDGKIFSVPTKADLYGMCLNADMFEAAGIPIPEKWTYSEFRDIAKRLTSGEGDSKIFGTFLNTQQDILSFMGYFGGQAVGGDWMYKNGSDKETNFDDPAIKESIQLFYDLMNTDKTAPSHTDSVTQKLTQEGMFLTGKSAMTIGPWIVRSIKDTENYPHDFKTAFAPYPVPDGAPAKYSQGNAGDLVSISAKTKNAEAAWEYVKWYATKGMSYMAGGGRVPLYNGYNSDDIAKAFVGDKANLLDEATVKSVLIKPRENYAIMTITTKGPELTQVVKEEMEAIFTDKKTVDQGLTDMKSRGDALLK